MSGEEHPVLTFLIQTSISFVVLWLLGIGLEFSAGGAYDGLIGVIAVPAAMAFLGNTLAVLIGLPARLNRSIRTWWSRHGEIALLLAILGIAIAVISQAVFGIDGTSSTDEFGDAYPYRSPNLALLAAGWFLIAFGLVNAWPPFGWLRHRRIA